MHNLVVLHRAAGHGSVVRAGWDKNRPVRPRLAVAALVLALGTTALAACGDSPDADAGTVTGRVMSLEDRRACVSPDRGEHRTCTDGPAPAGTEVGQCAEVAEGRLVVVDDAACSAGDVGD